MAPPPLLTLQNIHLTLGGGGYPLLAGADLSVAQGERLCLVGRNGSGKSTLLKIAAGQIEADSGHAVLPTRHVDPLPAAGARPRRLRHDARLCRGGARSARRSVSGRHAPQRPRPDRRRKPRVAFGRRSTSRPRWPGVLAPEPDILLLDEPTNHLDLPAIEWLESELKSLRSALVIISHDRRFLTNLSRSTVWIDRGTTRSLGKGFGEFEAWRDLQLEEEETQQHKLDRQIVNEEHWLRYGVTARRKRNQNRLARLQGLRTDRREHRRATGDVKLAASEAAVSGKLVIEAKGIEKSYGSRPIVKTFSTRVLRGDRLGIVGANGAGKTTLISLLTGTLAPDAGHIKLGANLEMATLDQKRASLDPTTTLKDALTGGGSDFVEVAGARKHVMGYMKDFLFGPEQARTPIGRLSGGERGRLMLARALAQPSNLLVLDEPTNDLDLETLDLLQEMLTDYPGTLLLVSHDRDFLDRVATGVLVSEGDGAWQEYAGGYTDMVAQRGEGVGGRGAAEAKAASGAARSDSAKPARAPSKEKLSFKEKHALETLPKTIAALDEKKSKLRRTLDDPNFYARDPSGFSKQSEAFAKIEADIAKAEEDWLALEMRRESIEG